MKYTELNDLNDGERAAATKVLLLLGQRYQWIGGATDAEQFTRAQVRASIEDVLAALRLSGEERLLRQEAESVAAQLYERKHPATRWALLSPDEQEKRIQHALALLRGTPTPPP